jgi:hypothetical protein
MDAIAILPDYFFHIPASSTGKYHPSYSLGDGGLYRHTKAAVRIAIELLRVGWWDFSSDEIDLIIVSLIMHDGWKSGVIQETYTRADHPEIAVDQLSINFSLEPNKTISNQELQFVMDAIESHMGKWNLDYKTNQEIMPKPSTKFQKFVHLADYLASRKCLEMNFDVSVLREG